MIHLDIEDYCHGCMDFEPCTDFTYLYENGVGRASDTKVFCAKCSRCERIVVHLKRKLAEEKKDDSDSDVQRVP